MFWVNFAKTALKIVEGARNVFHKENTRQTPNQNKRITFTGGNYIRVYDRPTFFSYIHSKFQTGRLESTRYLFVFIRTFLFEDISTRKLKLTYIINEFRRWCKFKVSMNMLCHLMLVYRFIICSTRWKTILSVVVSSRWKLKTKS